MHRERLRAVVALYLMLQACAVLAPALRSVSVVARVAAAAGDEDCCASLHPGKACPMGHRGRTPAATSRLSCGCGDHDALFPLGLAFDPPRTVTGALPLVPMSALLSPGSATIDRPDRVILPPPRA